MSNSPTRDALEIEVTDFGPIVEAKVDLRPLTVFVGPSNTGKSYLAILIYALHQHFAGGGPKFVTGNVRRFSPMLARGTVGTISKTIMGNLKEIAGALPNAEGSLTVTLPDAVTTAMRVEFETRMRFFEGEIARCFGVDNMATLIRREKTGGARIILRNISNALPPFKHELTLRSRGLESNAVIPKGISIEMRDVDKRSMYLFDEDTTDHQKIREIFYLLFSELRDRFSGPLRRSAFYLPADRTGVMHAHNVVVSALIERAAMTGIRPGMEQSPILSGVLADFLEQLIEIDSSRRLGRRRRTKVETTIEETILGGTIKVDKTGVTGYPVFTYLPNGWKEDSRLPLTRASSMVSELAPVVLYLRHIVNPGDVLIIEEPESHLHPAMQVEFTRQIATLVQSGVRVMVTTHSEWLLEGLANIVKRSEIPNRGRNNVAGRNPTLSPKDVGVWLFEARKRPRGSRVSEIRLGETGLYPSGFGRVAAELHNDWADMSGQSEN